jgi:wyosine [tRNA(Phe)-imidazoG37] synthetase (radical SAM superfamily)
VNEEILSGMVYGPVPSRRLGRSLGINNIPPVHCTYSCVYCQLGRNKKMISTMRPFYDPEKLAKQVYEKINEVRKKNEVIDYLSFVPDGEPSLDINIGKTIRLLKKTGIKIAVITNASLLSDKSAQENLMEADWVSLKVDAVRENTWHRINRPHKTFNLQTIRKGMIEFAGNFTGITATETMLVDGLNTKKDDITDTADFISDLKPGISYISIPIRPPAEEQVFPPDEHCVNMTYQIFTDRIMKVECLTGYEGNDFTQSGQIQDTILNITSVHPMREENIRKMLIEAKTDWHIIDDMIREKKLIEIKYNDIKFYLRKFR